MTPKRNNKNNNKKPSVQTSKGPIEGKTYFYNNGKSKYYGFKHIPYARHPVGDLRFADPQDFETFSEVTQLPNNPCDEYEDEDNRLSPEDYLYLNIYTPELRPENSDQHYTRPVIVFVPTFFPSTFPDTLEAAEFLLAEDIVLVVLFYRPDILGFSGIEEKNEEFDNISGYAGLKDIIKGFEYVKKEIRNFGGCPDNVTAYGQGLSCAYIRFLTIQPYYQQTLFHKMILSSSLEHNIKRTSHLRQYDLRDVAEAIIKDEPSEDVPPDLNFEDNKTCVEYLRRLSYDKLIYRSDPMMGEMNYRIVRKNNLLRIEGDLYEVQMPVLIGFNFMEGTIEQIMNSSRPKFPDDSKKLLKWLLLCTQTASTSNKANQKAATVTDFYKEYRFPSMSDYDACWAAIDTDVGYVIGTIMLARNLAREMDPENVYLYNFSANHGLNRAKMIYPNCPEYLGAVHGDELGYIFNFGAYVKRNSGEYKLIKRMCGIWARFARTGNPNPVMGHDAHYWRPIGKRVTHYFEIDTNYENYTRFADSDKVVLKFWESIYDIKFFSGPARESQLEGTDAETGENAETVVNNKDHSGPVEVRRYIIGPNKESRGESVTAHTSKGSIKGEVCGYNKVVYFSFQHVPYAQVPTGNLRFAAPKDISSFEDMKHLQLDEYGRYGPEDNLFLHIYTREVRPKATRRPVIVFVPGRLSAKAEQYRSEELYGPQFLLQQNVVLVVLSFRNDILGFTSFSEPNAELDVPIDAGVQDLIKGFLFVKNEIRHFGGCPDNVTAYGQGTGATYVRLLAARYPKGDLFRKMILSSSMEHATGVELPKPLYRVRFLVEQFLDKNTDMDDRACIKFLRELSIERLLKYDYPLFGEQPDRAFNKANLLGFLKESYKRKMPVLIGYNSMEGLLERYMSRRRDKHLELAWFVMARLKREENEDEGVMVARVTNFYNRILRTNDVIEDFSTDMIHSDVNYNIGTVALATHLARAMQPEPVFFYRFAVELHYNFTTNLYDCASMFGDNISQGAAHADELGYIFKTPFTEYVDPGSYEDLAIKRMTTLWAAFAKTGNPNPEMRNRELLDVTWRPMSEKKKLTHSFHINTRHVEYKQIPEVELTRFKFWQDAIGLNILTIAPSEIEENNDRFDSNLLGNARTKTKQGKKVPRCI